jgi:hypothetical protein
MSILKFSKDRFCLRFVFKWSYILLVCLAKNEDIPLHIENWNQTSFFDYGSPPLLTISKNIFNSENGAISHTFVPHYGVLKKNLGEEGSVYIILAEPADVLLFFYPSKHPDSPNYKIDVNSYSIDVCEDTKKCKKIKDCEKAIVNNTQNGTNNPNMVFLSWKLFEQNLLVILGQYKDTLFKCRNYKHNFVITKLVMNSSKHQLTKIIDGSFLSTTKELPAKSNKHFDLLENSYVSLHIFQCYFCNISVKLTCGNPVVNKEVILGRDGNQMIFSNSFLIYGWIKIDLTDLTKKGQKYNNCSLVIVPKLLELVNQNQVNPIWTIAQSVITYLQDPERLMEVSTTTSTASSTISDSGTSAKISDENQFNGNDSQKKINWVDDKVQTSYDRWRWWIISNTILLVIISVCIVVILLLKLVRYSGLSFDKQLFCLFHCKK